MLCPSGVGLNYVHCKFLLIHTVYLTSLQVIMRLRNNSVLHHVNSYIANAIMIRTLDMVDNKPSRHFNKIMGVQYTRL